MLPPNAEEDVTDAILKTIFDTFAALLQRFFANTKGAA